MSHTLLQLVIAAFAFFVTNWIGKHSIQLGYMSLTLGYRSGEAPAFNVVYRAFAPVAIMVIAAAFLHYLSLDRQTTNIYLVVVYYFVLRVLFYFLTQRVVLVDWSEFLLVAICSATMAYFVYTNLVVSKEYLLPSTEDIGSAVWLAIAAFVYKTFNSVQTSNQSHERKRERYIQAAYVRFRALYGHLLLEMNLDPNEERLIWSVMVYESFNRPLIYRFLERSLRRILLARTMTLGPMQVSTRTNVTDEESVQIGATRLVEDYRKALKDHGQIENEWEYVDLRRKATSAYNVRSDYPYEVEAIYQILESQAEADQAKTEPCSGKIS